MRKNGSSVIWSFFQVTKVEKRASRKRFLKSRRSRDFGMFSRCPFFNRGNLEKTSNYTRTIFLTVCQNNYDNRVLFRNVLVFSYERGDHWPLPSHLFPYHFLMRRQCPNRHPKLFLEWNAECNNYINYELRSAAQSLSTYFWKSASLKVWQNSTPVRSAPNLNSFSFLCLVLF